MVVRIRLWLPVLALVLFAIYACNGREAPTGPQGSASVAGYEVVQHSETTTGNERDMVTVEASCPTGKRVIGGGYSVLPGGGGVYTTRPNASGTGWVAVFYFGGVVTLTSYAICAVAG